MTAITQQTERCEPFVPLPASCRQGLPPAPARTRSAGYSLVEVIIAAVLLAMMIFAVATLSLSGTEAQEYARRLNRVTEVTQDVLDQVRLELVSSVRLFGNNAEGNANLAVLDLAGAPAPLGGLRLPTIDANGSVRADTAGNEITGNTMFFTRLAWSDRFVCSSGNEYLIDVYRWVYYYMTPEDGGPAAGSSVGLNLVRVLSEPLIDGSAIDRITDPTDQSEVLLHMLNATPDALGTTHSPTEVVWLRGNDPSVTGTLRQIDPSTGTLEDDPITATGRPDPWRVLRAEANVQGMLAYRHHSIATVHARPSFGVGRFSVVSMAGSGFPHGFEVQIVGPSSARQVLLHMVVASTNRRGHTAWSDMQIVSDTRDL
jgi:type II secretory pathway pseudopilin PulG